MCNLDGIQCFLERGESERLDRFSDVDESPLAVPTPMTIRIIAYMKSEILGTLQHRLKASRRQDRIVQVRSSLEC
jgi:hypothetical protein